MTTLIAKKFPSANLTSGDYPLDLLIFSAILSFDRQVPAFLRPIFLMDFPASDLISLGWSVLSIYPTVREIFLMGGIVGRLNKKKPQMEQKSKEEPRLQSFSPRSAQSDSWVGHGRGHERMGKGVIPSFLFPTFSVNFFREFSSMRCCFHCTLFHISPWLYKTAPTLRTHVIVVGWNFFLSSLQ